MVKKSVSHAERTFSVHPKNVGDTNAYMTPRSQRRSALSQNVEHVKVAKNVLQKNVSTVSVFTRERRPIPSVLDFLIVRTVKEVQIVSLCNVSAKSVYPGPGTIFASVS